MPTLAEKSHEGLRSAILHAELSLYLGSEMVDMQACTLSGIDTSAKTIADSFGTTEYCRRRHANDLIWR